MYAHASGSSSNGGGNGGGGGSGGSGDGARAADKVVGSVDLAMSPRADDAVDDESCRLSAARHAAQ